LFRDAAGDEQDHLLPGVVVPVRRDDIPYQVLLADFPILEPLHDLVGAEELQERPVYEPVHICAVQREHEVSFPELRQDRPGRPRRFNLVQVVPGSQVVVDF
jgi:hypothetical protein